jgi:hypothetical protein
MNNLEKIFNALLSRTRSQDIKRELARYATESTAAYVRKNLRSVQSVESVPLVHEIAISNITVSDGLALEFGVYSGKTINLISSKKNWTVHGFDSFEGLPESWRDGYAKGHFALNALPKVNANVKLHKGWFEDSIPEFMSSMEHKTSPISYLHVDCDLYSSTKTIFNLLGNNIVKGTVIVFDEYFNYDGWENGEFLAFQEFVKSQDIKYRYLTYNALHEQVAVVIE